jgi:hypothetical protein
MRTLFLCTVMLLTALRAWAQKVSGSFEEDLRHFVETPALPGYEQELAAGFIHVTLRI